MVEHEFGGSWTEEKVKRLKEYLAKYRQVFKNQSWCTTWYVDAFAGTGTRKTGDVAAAGFGEDDFGDAEVSAYLDGSARIALGLASPFDRYLFIEKARQRVDELKRIIGADFPELESRCAFRQEDANVAIARWVNERNWKKDRAVVFLDPYGFQVSWKTVELLGRTKAVDLWYLFPSPARLLTRDGVIEDSWRTKLTDVFGTSEWEPHFYKKLIEADLFGEYERTERDATVANIQKFIHDRLQTCFAAVAPSLVLRNSTGSPQFVLCFAAANEKGASIAIPIAKSLLK